MFSNLSDSILSVIFNFYRLFRSETQPFSTSIFILSVIEGTYLNFFISLLEIWIFCDSHVLKYRLIAVFAMVISFNFWYYLHRRGGVKLFLEIHLSSKIKIVVILLILAAASLFVSGSELVISFRKQIC